MTDTESKRPPLVIIAGPTASGKTEASIRLAGRIGGEIISADSMQVYRHMDIGTAKITREEMQGVRHHLIDCLDPDEPFSVMTFQTMARRAVEEILQRGAIPIVTGGTGFYIQALLKDVDFTPTPSDPVYRRALEERARRGEGDVLYEELKAADPDAALSIHPHNLKRVIRALEYVHLTGTPISAHNAEQKQKTGPYHSAFFVLTWPRDILYDRINRRVDQMIENGLVSEVRALLDAGYDPGLTSMQGLGYKEIVPYIEGRCTLEEAVTQLKTGTRHFAKRQLTWFRAVPDVIWIERTPDTTAEWLESAMTDELFRCGII